MIHAIAISIVALAMVQDAGQQVAPPAVHEEGQGIPAMPATPAPAGEILWARAFEVDEPWASDFRADHPMIQRGFILVLKADAALAFPRQVACPVLMAGDMPCEVIEPVAGSEYVVAIAASLDTAGTDPAQRARSDSEVFAALELYWAAPMLPEQMTVDVAVAACDVARTSGVATAWRGGEPGEADKPGLDVDPLARELAGMPTPGQCITVQDRAAIVAIAVAARAALLAN